MNRETQRDAEYRTTKRRKTLNDNGMGLPILARKSVDGHSMQTYLEKIRHSLRHYDRERERERERERQGCERNGKKGT